MGMFKSTSSGGGIYTSNVAPSNTKIPWMDTSVIPNAIKYYNSSNSDWEVTGSSSSSPNATYVSVTTGGNIPNTSTNSQIAVSDLYGQVGTITTSVTELTNNKLNKVVSPTNTDILITDPTGVPIDSGIKITAIAKSSDLIGLAKTSDLKTVATSGLYSDLTGTPTIPTKLSDLTSDVTHEVVTDTEIANWNNKGNGDMTKANYDKTNNGIVDSAETLNGLTSTITELNSLVGITGNVQTQINTLSSIGNYKGKSNTYALISTLVPTPHDKDMVIVSADENHSNLPSIYVYSLSAVAWQYVGAFTATVRDFSTTPINLSTEVTGILSTANIDPLIARESDINNIKGYLNYTVARTYNAIGKTEQEIYSGDITKTVNYTYFANTSEFYKLVSSIVIVEGNKTTTQLYGYQSQTQYLMTITTTVVTS